MGQSVECSGHLDYSREHEQDGNDGYKDEQEVLRVGWWSVHGVISSCGQRQWLLVG
jgi:hypothetical protein